MKVKEVKELPPEKKEVKEEPEKEEKKEDSEDKEVLEVQEEGFEIGIDRIEQFREEFLVEFFPEATLLSSSLEERVWQPKNLEETLKDVPGKLEEPNARGGDFYKDNSSGAVYGAGSGSSLYNGSGGSDLYNGSAGDEMILYSPFEEPEDERAREFGHRDVSRLEIEGINRRFGEVHNRGRNRDKNKYNA
jgi:hypothetical protein